MLYKKSSKKGLLWRQKCLDGIFTLDFWWGGRDYSRRLRRFIGEERVAENGQVGLFGSGHTSSLLQGL